MTLFARALKKAAESLEIGEDVLGQALTQAGINEGVWSHVREDEFVAEVGNRLKTKSQERTAFRLRAAFAVMTQTFQGTPVGLPPGVSPKSATVEQLIQAVDIRDPGSDVMAALLQKTVPGQKGIKMHEVAFFALRGEGEAVELDRERTRAVIDLLRRGMPPAEDELLDPATKQTYVVYSYDELPTAQTQVIDPLFPDEVLHLGAVSTQFNVLVPRPGFDEEKHRLLLFLRIKEKVKAPKDKPAYEETVELFAKDRVEELLDRYGARGVYEKAKRLPIGSGAGLPSICRSEAGNSAAVYCTDCDSAEAASHCSGCGVPFDEDEDEEDDA